MMVVRERIILIGSVQGVGLRYRAVHSARRLSLCGTVCNNSDGSVTIEAEGEERAIDDLLDMLEAGSFIRFDSVTRTRIPVQGGYSFDCID